MTDNPYGIKIAKPADAEALLRFVMHIYAEDAAQPLSVRKIAAIVTRCTEGDRAIAGVVNGPDGEIEASVGATIDEFDYTDEPHVMIRWLGVGPAFRRTDRASRLMNYVRWLFETMSTIADKPVPVFIPSLITSEHEKKVLFYQRRAPMVGVLHAFGCLPDRSFFDPSQAGKWRSSGKDSKKVAVVAASRPLIATAAVSG